MDKLHQSNADFIIVNDVGKKGIGFGSPENEVYVLGRSGLLLKIDKTSKEEVAKRLVDIII